MSMNIYQECRTLYVDLRKSATKDIHGRNPHAVSVLETLEPATHDTVVFGYYEPAFWRNGHYEIYQSRADKTGFFLAGDELYHEGHRKTARGFDQNGNTVMQGSCGHAEAGSHEWHEIRMDAEGNIVASIDIDKTGSNVVVVNRLQDSRKIRNLWKDSVLQERYFYDADKNRTAYEKYDNGVRHERIGNDGNYAVYPVVDGMKHGSVEIRDKNDHVIDRMLYQNGKGFTGVVETRHDNGLLRSTTPFVDGLRHGTRIAYDEQGDVSFMTFYKQNTREMVYKRSKPKNSLLRRFKESNETYIKKIEARHREEMEFFASKTLKPL